MTQQCVAAWMHLPESVVFALLAIVNSMENDQVVL
jgi:hypothetical protein